MCAYAYYEGVASKNIIIVYERLCILEYGYELVLASSSMHSLL